jgi:hypothetical protein
MSVHHHRVVISFTGLASWFIQALGVSGALQVMVLR